MTDYYFYMDSILLPVTPSKMSIKIANKNTTLDMASGGEINIPKQPGLTEISFDVLLPSVQYPFARYDSDFKSPNYYLEHFEQLKTNRKAFDFIVIRTVTAQMLLRHAIHLSTLPTAVLQDYDLDGDGKISSTDARILLRSDNGIAVLSDTNIKCLLEEYTVEEDAEKYGQDFSVSITLKQYVDYGLKKATYKLA